MAGRPAIGAVFLLCLLMTASADAPPFERGPGWVAWLGSFPAGGQAELWIETAGPAAAGIEVKTGPVRHSATWLFGGRSTEVGSNAIGGDVMLPWSAERSLQTLRSSIPAGEAQVLLWTAGDISSWRYQLHGSSEPHLAARSHHAFFWDGSTGAEGVHAHVSVDGRGLSVTNATYSFAVKGELRGAMGILHDDLRLWPLPAQDLSDHRIELKRPDGSRETCLCLAAPAWGPGEYELTWEGRTVHSPGDQPVLLIGVDAPASFE